MTITIPDSTLKSANISEQEFLVDLAAYLYDKERCSFGQARTISGLNHTDFQRALARRDVLIKFDKQDLLEDISAANAHFRKQV